MAVGPSLAGIALDGEVVALDIAQPAQLIEKRRPSPRPCVAEVSDRPRWGDDRDPVLLRALPRLHRLGGGREQQNHREIAPSRSTTVRRWDFTPILRHRQCVAPVSRAAGIWAATAYWRLHQLADLT
jgi:hypothetical protein